MKKLTKQYSKLTKFILVPFLLILFWFFTSLFLNEQISFSVIRYTHSLETFKNFDSGVLLKENKIRGEIEARDNHFGIVSLRFNDFLADYQTEETVSFRIKEKGQKEWHSDTNYRIGLLRSSSLFPFGISPVSDSKGKKYVFEVKSSSPNPGNAITISKDQPVVFSSYQFPKAEIAQSPKHLFNYMFKKTINSLTNKDFLFSSIIYLLPLIFYLIFLTRAKFSTNNLIFLIILNLIYLDSIFLGTVMIPSAIAIFAGWVVYLKRFGLDKTKTLLMALFLILVWIFLAYFKVADYSYKISFWVYCFLALGIVQIILENRSNEKV